MAKKKILASIMAGIMAMTMAVPTFAAQIDPADCDHEFGYWRYTVKPTCTTEGKGDMYCPDCGSIVEKDATIKPLGHEFSNATTRNGNFYLVCERCGAEEKQALTAEPATCPHDEDDIGIYNDHEATCTEDGYTGDTYCTACGTLLEKGEVDEKAHGHDWEEDSNACQLPTCTESGKDFYVCRECGEREERVTQPLGHSWEKTKVTPATCTKDGKTVYTCSTCDETKEEITEKATGHKWNDGKVTTAPTTTSTGVKTFTCLTCGETKTEEIAKLPEESKPSKPADTTTEGKKDDTKPSTDKKDDTKPSTDKKEDTQPSTDKKNDTKPSTDKKDNTTVVNPTKPAKKAAKVGTKFVVAGQTYKVTKAGKEVSFIAAKKNAKKISIPATVKSKGITYKVTSIAAKAVKNNKKVKSVVVGANVKKIANKAFFKCPNLKKITIKSVKFTKKNLNKKAFKGLHKKLVVKVPKKVYVLKERILKEGLVK